MRGRLAREVFASFRIVQGNLHSARVSREHIAARARRGALNTMARDVLRIAVCDNGSTLIDN